MLGCADYIGCCSERTFPNNGDRLINCNEPALEVLNSLSSLMISHHASYKGERLSYHGIYFAVEKIGEIAHIEDLHPHFFRHTYATDLLLLGVDPSHARKLTGHQSEKAFRRYTLRVNKRRRSLPP